MGKENRMSTWITFVTIISLIPVAIAKGPGQDQEPNPDWTDHYSEVIETPGPQDQNGPKKQGSGVSPTPVPTSTPPAPGSNGELLESAGKNFTLHLPIISNRSGRGARRLINRLPR